MILLLATLASAPTVFSAAVGVKEFAAAPSLGQVVTSDVFEGAVLAGVQMSPRESLCAALCSSTPGCGAFKLRFDGLCRLADAAEMARIRDEDPAAAAGEVVDGVYMDPNDSSWFTTTSATTTTSTTSTSTTTTSTITEGSPDICGWQTDMDGDAASESLVATSMTKETCIQHCTNLGSPVNGATFGHNTGACYCESDMTGYRPWNDYDTTFLGDCPLLEK